MVQNFARRFIVPIFSLAGFGVGCGIGSCICASPATAQDAQALPGASAGIAVGGELDNYLRYLQTEGAVPLTQWGLRGFAPTMVDSITKVTGNHPWASSWLFGHASVGAFRVLPVEITTFFNTGYPFGINEGPVWAGRGLTTSVSAGFAGAWGPLTVVVKPIVFRAENSAFTLQPTGLTGNGVFADPLFPTSVDRPQRFGNSAYTHVDPGETTIRLDGWGASAGVTTANEWWGPATVFPYIVGNNAAGVPRVFLGTERPTNIFIGTLQARVEYGMEFQSAYSPVDGPDTFTNLTETGQRRFMSALVATFAPSGIDGLEIGGGRYFHRPWTGHVTGSDLRSPLEGLLTASPVVTASESLSSSELSNQLASVWMRWVFPHSGLEVYGEYGHEDHNIDLNDLLGELDHSRTAMLGFRKMFAHDHNVVDGFRAEFFDGTESTVARHRGEGAIYLHSVLHQGHTEEGKVIGAGAGVGTPAGLEVAWDRYIPSGRWSAYTRHLTEDPAHTTNEAGISGVRFAGLVDLTFDAGVMRSTGGQGWNGTIRLGVASHQLSLP